MSTASNALMSVRDENMKIHYSDVKISHSENHYTMTTLFRHWISIVACDLMNFVFATVSLMNINYNYALCPHKSTDILFKMMMGRWSTFILIIILIMHTCVCNFPLHTSDKFKFKFFIRFAFSTLLTRINFLIRNACVSNPRVYTINAQDVSNVSTVSRTCTVTRHEPSILRRGRARAVSPIVWKLGYRLDSLTH